MPIEGPCVCFWNGHYSLLLFVPYHMVYVGCLLAKTTRSVMTMETFCVFRSRCETIFCIFLTLRTVHLLDCVSVPNFTITFIVQMTRNDLVDLAGLRRIHPILCDRPKRLLTTNDNDWILKGHDQMRVGERRNQQPTTRRRRQPATHRAFLLHSLFTIPKQLSH